jgi:multidrug efflux pump subunit AcrA (membrane-fusion protein)
LTGREEKIIGALVVEGQKDQPIDESLQKLSAAVATQGGRALAAAQELEFLPLAKQLRWLEKMRDKLYGDEGKAMLARWGLPAAGVVLLACLPWRLSVSGDCVVRPVKRAEVAAEVPGRIVQVFVTEGQTVTNGQALAQLDDAESQQSLKMAEQEKLKSETEADRLQMLGDDGGRRLSLINAARTERQIEQLKERIGKARLRSPIHGVILTKDLQARLGDFLQVGAAFCAVADLSRWEVETRVKESEILLVDRALRKGKEIPLSFLLYGLPNDDMRGIVRGLDSVSQISYQVPQANVFMVRADVDVPARLQQELKTGYSGRGRMAVGWRPVIWVAIRKFVNYVHVRWLF